MASAIFARPPTEGSSNPCPPIGGFGPAGRIGPRNPPGPGKGGPTRNPRPNAKGRRPGRFSIRPRPGAGGACRLFPTLEGNNTRPGPISVPFPRNRSFASPLGFFPSPENPFATIAPGTGPGNQRGRSPEKRKKPIMFSNGGPWIPVPAPVKTSGAISNANGTPPHRG